LIATRLRVEPAALNAERIEIAGDGFHYLVRVRRLGPGDAIELFDGGGRRATAAIESVSPDRAAVRRTGAPTADAPAPVRIISLVALIKGERMDLAVTKLVELGVATIAPIATERSVVRLDDERAEARRRRFERLASEAARQCGRADVPEIRPVAPFARAIATAEAELRLIFSPDPGATGLRRALAAGAPSSLCLATGPEGGFTPAELATAAGAGFAIAGLGPRILRAETAAIAAAAAASALLGLFDFPEPCPVI
jgi:16S rRNA (uracil1498-N3)-methyltransferase